MIAAWVALGALIVVAALVYRHIDRSKRQRNYIHERPVADERDSMTRFKQIISEPKN